MAKSPDELFLAQALHLARLGVGLASPNPCVGAVIVDDRGRIVGRGHHVYDRRKHAEVIALEEAGPLARGNTLYLNLEPCSHTGRTGPCAEAVVAAGVGRVVCCMEDPNPLVAGRGFARLREAGIEVEVGIMQAQARKLNESFAKFIRTRKPLVTLKASLTLDGKIAPAKPKEKAEVIYLSGQKTLEHIHILRHASDAILIGIGTALIDNPQLTDRSGLARRRPILRVVIDSQLRLPLESKLVKTAQNDLLVITCSSDSTKRLALEQRGVRVEQVEADERGRVNLAKALDVLGTMEILSVLVEGGSAINSTFLNAGLADKLWLHFAPKLFGPAGVPWLKPEASISSVFPTTLNNVSIHHFGEDIGIEAYLRDVYRTGETKNEEPATKNPLPTTEN
jgi:diaminohydroxyphosphoribosylaminopyrimidine deaminase/5-amino-6-(5-phosphoribosylamino)uracil reductase